MTAPQEGNFIHTGNRATNCICKTRYKSLFYLPQISRYFILLYFSVQVIFTFYLKPLLHVNAHCLRKRKLRSFFKTQYRPCCSSPWNGDCMYNTGVYDYLLAFCYCQFLHGARTDTFKRFAGVEGRGGGRVLEAKLLTFYLSWCNSPSVPRPPHYRGFMITLRRTTVGRTPLDE